MQETSSGPSETLARLMQQIQDPLQFSALAVPESPRGCPTPIQHYPHSPGVLASRAALTRSRTSARCRFSLCSLLRILSMSHWRSSIMVSRTDTRDSAVSTLSCSLENCNQRSASASMLHRISFSEAAQESFFSNSSRVFHLLLWWQTTPWTVLNFTRAKSQDSNKYKTKLKTEKAWEVGNIWQNRGSHLSLFKGFFDFNLSNPCVHLL